MSDVLDRIQKLLNLAKNATNEHEAAAAANRAKALMAEHEITEAELRFADSSAKTAPEEIIKRHVLSFGATKRVGWHWAVAAAVARSYGVKPYWAHKQVGLFGRLSAVQATDYTARYLVREIVQLCDREAHHGATRRWRNAFRLGAAARIAERLREQAPPGASARRGSAKPVLGEEDWTEAEIRATSAPPVSPSAGAIAIVERDRKEVEEEYTRYSKKWGTVRGVGRQTSGDGYRAGSAAAGRIVLSGARGSLKRGTEVLS